MTAGPAALPERPPVSSPDRPRESSWIVTSQPRLGLIGLVLVVPIAAALAVGAGGPERSALVLGPLVTYALPLVAVVAFWWEDWPGTRLRPSWSGWADTALIAGGAVVLTAAGQTVVAGLDLRGIFDAFPGPGHTPTFPATMPLAAAAFVAMLELTLVGEGWPLRRLPRLRGRTRRARALVGRRADRLLRSRRRARRPRHRADRDRRLAGADLRRAARLAVLVDRGARPRGSPARMPA